MLQWQRQFAIYCAAVSSEFIEKYLRVDQTFQKCAIVHHLEEVVSNWLCIVGEFVNKNALIRFLQLN